MSDSLADTLLRIDEGAVVGSHSVAIAAGIAAALPAGHVPPASQAPGAPVLPLPGGNAFMNGVHEKAVNARRARVKAAASYTNLHINDPITNDVPSYNLSRGLRSGRPFCSATTRR